MGYKRIVAKLRSLCLCLFAFTSLPNALSQTIPEFDSLIAIGEELYFDNDETDSALVVFYQAYDIATQLFQPLDSNLATVHSYLGYAYQDLGDLKKAEFHRLESFGIIKIVFGKTHEYYDWGLDDLATLYKLRDECDKANAYYDTLLELRIKKLGGSHKNVVKIYLKQAQCLKKLKRYDQACALLDSINQPFLEAFGKYDNSYLSYRNEYAQLLTSIKDYASAIEVWDSTLQIGQEMLFTGNHKTDVTIYVIMSNLANWYTYLDKTEKVLKLRSELVDISRKVFGKTSVQYESSVRLLGSRYLAVGDHKNALVLANEAQEVSEALHKKDQWKKYRTYKLKSAIYLGTNSLDSAMYCINKAVDIVSSELGQAHLIYGRCLLDKAEVYREQHKIKLALQTALEARKIFDNEYNQNVELFSNEWKFYLTSSVRLAFLYRNIGEFTTALEYARENYELMKSHRGPQSWSSMRGASLLSTIYISAGYEDSAVSMMKISNAILQQELINVFGFQSESDKRLFMDKNNFYFDIYQSNYLNSVKKPSDLLELNLNNVLKLKGMVLNSTRDIFQELKELNDPLTKQMLDTFTRLNKLQINGIISKSSNTIELQHAKKNIESKIVKRHRELIGGGLDFEVTWQDVQERLGNKEIAIEFTSFKYLSPTDWTDSIKYGAYLIHKDWDKPKFIYLFEEKELLPLLNNGVSSLYASRGGKVISNKVVEGNQNLYVLVWSKIEKAIEALSIKTIYYSPQGQLNKVAFAALSENDKVLGRKYNLVQLSSTTELIRGLTNPKINHATLIGGVYYNPVFPLPETLPKQEQEGVNEGFRGHWRSLPGTKLEIDELSKILTGNRVDITTLKGDLASELSVKELQFESGSCVHIATHGFFFDKNDKVHFSKSNNPLIRSGLILAGANYAWKYGENPFQKEDGILTSLEMSNLNWSNVDIVVLSACETALGDIDKNEGVFGLQRALKLAGVDIVMMSLWPVPDQETAQFMTLFYRYWMKSSSVRKAFRKAQLAMYKRFPDDASKWAGFILVQ